MKAIHIWGAIISLLLCANAFFTYKSALVYEDVPYAKLPDGNKKLYCAQTSICPKEWHLRGTE